MTSINNQTTQANNRPYDPSQTTTTSAPTAATGTNVTPPQSADPNASRTASVISSQDSQQVQPPASNYVITEDNATQALNDLLSSSNAIANPLTIGADNAGIYQPMYHFRLFMTQEADLFKNVSNADLSAVYKNFDTIDKVIIAESGVTAGFNITDVEIEDIISPGQDSRNCSVTSFKITIVDVLGTSLMETIREIGKLYKINNLLKYWFYLELTFKGYDSTGQLQTNILQNSGLPNGGRWIWQMTMTNLDVRIDETGSTHVMSGLPTPMTAFDDFISAVPDKMTITGGTIKEMFDDLASNLNMAYDRRYGGPLYKFKIVNRGIQGSSTNPDTFGLTVQETDNQRNVSLSIDKKNGASAQIARGTPIADVIDFLFMHSQDAQKIILDVKTPDSLIDGSTDNPSWNGKDWRTSIVFRVETDVVITGYDPITDTYIKEITYNVWGYQTYRPILCPEQVKSAQKSKAQPVKIAKALKDAGFLNKHYDYMYTGMNTEVISLDIHFNTNIIIPVPQLLGWRASYDGVAYHAKASDSAKQPNNPTITGDSVLKMTTDQLSAQYQSIIQDEDAMKQANAQVDASNNKDYAAKEQQRLLTYTELQKRRTQLATKDTISYNSTNTYAEDLADANLKYDVVLKPSFQQSGDEARNAAGGAMLNQSTPGTYFASALYDQMYAPPSDAMVSITMEIRGDPYWLGHSNFERRAVMNNINNAKIITGSTLLPNYLAGDNCCSIKFRFPFAVSDDTFEPIFREDDVFNGVYMVTRVRNIFSHGDYRQQLDCLKNYLINSIVTKVNPSSDTASQAEQPSTVPTKQMSAADLKKGISSLLSGQKVTEQPTQ